jgi:hypothetical protein
LHSLGKKNPLTPNPTKIPVVSPKPRDFVIFQSGASPTSHWHIWSDAEIGIDNGNHYIFKIITPGLWGEGISFKYATHTGFYLLHYIVYICCHQNHGSHLFKLDATFKPAAAVSGVNGYESYFSINCPGCYICLMP